MPHEMLRNKDEIIWLRLRLSTPHLLALALIFVLIGPIGGAKPQSSSKRVQRIQESSKNGTKIDASLRNKIILPQTSQDDVSASTKSPFVRRGQASRNGLDWTNGNINIGRGNLSEFDDNENDSDNGRVHVEAPRARVARRLEVRRLLARRLSALVMNKRRMGEASPIDQDDDDDEADLKLGVGADVLQTSSPAPGEQRDRKVAPMVRRPDLGRTRAENLQGARDLFVSFVPSPASTIRAAGDGALSTSERPPVSPSGAPSPLTGRIADNRREEKRDLMSKNVHVLGERSNDASDDEDPADDDREEENYVMMMPHKERYKLHDNLNPPLTRALSHGSDEGAAIAVQAKPAFLLQSPQAAETATAPSDNNAHQQHQQMHNFDAMGTTTIMVGSSNLTTNLSAATTIANGDNFSSQNYEGIDDYLLEPGEDETPIVCDNVDSNLFRRDQVIEMSDQQLANLSFKGTRRELLYCVERRFRMMKVITTIITPILFTFIILIGLVGNIAVILVIWEDRKQERELSPPNLLILDLSLADLSFIIFCIPFTGWDYAVGHWIFGDTWCRLNQYLIVVCALSSIYTLVLMSVDRFMAVVYPIQCIRIRTSRNTLYAILVKWIIILLISTPAARMHGSVVMNDNTQWQCRFLMQEYNAVHFQIIFFLASYLLPLALIFVLYMGLLNKLWFGNKPMGHRESSKMVESKKKVTWLVAGIVIVFAICWCPIQIMLIMMRLQMHEITITYVAIQVFAHILGYMNSCVNPIVYAFASENFNNSFRRSKLGRLFRAATPWLQHVDPHDAHSRGGAGTLGGVSNSNNRPMHNSQSQVHTGSIKNNSNNYNYNSSFINKNNNNQNARNNNDSLECQNRNSSLNVCYRDNNDNRSQYRDASQTNSTILDCSTPSKLANTEANTTQTSPSSGETQTSTVVTGSYPLSPIETNAFKYSDSNNVPKVVATGSSLSQPTLRLEPRDRCEFKLQQQLQEHPNICSKSSDRRGSLRCNSNVIEQQKQNQEPTSSEPDLKHNQQHQQQQQLKLSNPGNDQISSSVNGGHNAVLMPKQQLVAQVSQSDNRSISHRCEPFKQQI